MNMKRVAVITALVILATCRVAAAEGFALYEYSARGVALGGATMARKADPSAVASNPALITQLQGAQVLAGVTAIMPSGKMDTSYGGVERTSSLRENTWFVPHAYYTQQLNDDWYLGVGAFSRFGLGFKYSPSWPGRYNIYEVDLQTVSINPNIAWKATDSLSLAAGIELMQVSLDMNKKAAIPGVSPMNFNNPNVPQVDSDINNADGTGIGVNLAGHYQFNEQWAAGVLYRSQVQQRARGENEFTVENIGGLSPGTQAALRSRYQDSSARSEVIMPDSVAGGVSWTPTKDLSFEAGAIWTRWSTFRTLRIHLGEPMNTVSESKKKWDDAWRLNFGVEYAANDWLTLRAGYVYDQSPMTDDHADYLVPTDGRNIYSAGVGLKWGNFSTDLTYAYIDAKGRSYDENLAYGVLDSKAKNAQTHMISTSLMYVF